jgi:hypothetical protein
MIFPLVGYRSSFLFSSIVGARKGLLTALPSDEKAAWIGMVGKFKTVTR